MNNKKNNSMIILVAVIVLAIIAIIILKVGIKKPEPISQSDIEINQSVTSDTTQSITDNLNSINVDEEVGTDEFNTVDQELEKL